MSHFRTIAVFWSVAVAAGITTASPVSAQDRPLVPRDVIDLWTRRAACVAWSKDMAGYRATVTEDFIQSQKCDDIAKDEAALRDKYAGNSELVRMIGGPEHIIVRRQPARNPPPSDSK